MVAGLSTVLDLAEECIERREMADEDCGVFRLKLANVRRKLIGDDDGPEVSLADFAPAAETIAELKANSGTEYHVATFDSNSVAYHHKLRWQFLGGFDVRTARIPGQGIGVYSTWNGGSQ